MTEIATEFDTLYTETVALVTAARTDSSFLYLNLEGLLDDKFLRSRFQSDPASSQFRDLANEIMQGLKSKSELSELGNWEEAILLEADWTSRESTFTPDFGLYFDPGSHCRMRGVVRGAFSVLSGVYAIFGADLDDGALEDFKSQARSVAETLRKQIDSVGNTKRNLVE